MEEEHGFSVEQLKEVAAELMTCAATAIHALCEPKMEENEVDALVVECALFVLCAQATEYMTKKEFLELAAAGYEEMAAMNQMGGECHTTMQ